MSSHADIIQEFENCSNLSQAGGEGGCPAREAPQWGYLGISDGGASQESFYHEEWWGLEDENYDNYDTLPDQPSGHEWYHAVHCYRCLSSCGSWDKDMAREVATSSPLNPLLLPPMPRFW